MDHLRLLHEVLSERSPVEVLRVTKEGLVKQRIQQFDRAPSTETSPVQEHTPRRRQTLGEVELRKKVSQSISLPKRSSTLSRPVSCYDTTRPSRISKIGSAQDLRFVSPSHSSTRRCSASPDYSHFSSSPPPPSQMDLLHKSTNLHENIVRLDITSVRIRPRNLPDNDSNCSYNSLARTPPLHRELESTKSLPILTNIPPIIVKVRKPSNSDSSDKTQHSSSSSDKTPSQLLSPSPDSTDKFTKRFISSPPLSRRRPAPLEASTLSPPPRLRSKLQGPDVASRSEAERTGAEDSSNDDVFGSPDHSTSGREGTSFRLQPPSTSNSLGSGSEEGRDGVDLPTKSPARKPSLLRRKQGQGISNAERKKRTVTFTPEVLLLQLCFEGRLKDIEKILLDPEIDAECINSLGPMGITAMHQCALDGNVGCLQALVNAGGNVDVVDAENCTPLHSAAINNHFSAIRFLLMAGADPSKVDDDNKTAHDIATDERVKKVLMMALQGSFTSANTSHDSKENSIFVFDQAASEQRDEEYTTGLSNPTPRDTESNKGVSSIISHKRDSNWEDKPVQNREFMGIKMTNKKKDGTQNSEDDVSFTSSYSGCSGELSGLNSSCGNSDDSPCKSPMAFSTTALHSSTNTNSSVGTDILERDNLTAYDVDSDLEPESEDFKFQEAVSNQDVPAVTKILRDSQGSIDINRITRLGITALHHSVLEENYLLTHKLVSEGKADVNIRDRDGWTPLHAASAVGNLKIAKFLVDSGARTSLWNSSGEFAVDVAEDDAMKRYLHSIMLGPHAIKKRFPSMLT